MNDTQSDPESEQATAAGADHREWDAHWRDDPGHHHQVERRLKADPPAKPSRHESRKPVRRPNGGQPEQPRRDTRQEEHDRNRTGEARLLSYRYENEV